MLSRCLPSLLIAASLCLLTVWFFVKYTQYAKEPRPHLPPFAPLTHEEIISTPQESLTRAFEKYGAVFRIQRNGVTEYLVAKEHTHKVLTDERTFSFMHGVAKMLGLVWIFNLHGGTFFHDMHTIVKDYLAQHMSQVLPEIWPLFQQGASDLANAASALKPKEILPFVQLTMAEATLRIFFGDTYKGAKFSSRVVDLAEDIVELTGLFQNQSLLARRLPYVWRVYTWVKIVLFRIPIDLGPAFAIKLWRDISKKQVVDREKGETILCDLHKRYQLPNGRIPITSRLWIFVLILGILFASLHQTVTTIVWVTFHLALRPDCQELIHNELLSIMNKQDGCDLGSIADQSNTEQAKLTDSIIREILRLKGDCVSAIRSPAHDLHLGGYLIPKGSLVLPITFLSHQSSDFLPDPFHLEPKRWVNTGKSTATCGPGFLTFGLGRWACPGRGLATAEIKFWILAMVHCCRFRLDGHKYEVVDYYLTISIPPQGRLVCESR